VRGRPTSQVKVARVWPYFPHSPSRSSALHGFMCHGLTQSW
jgi:hypothetical protein